MEAADSGSASPVALEWGLFEWATRHLDDDLSWYEWMLLQYSIQVACGSMGLGAGAAFSPFAGAVTYEICTVGLAA
jgi:hypothetical protein